MQNVILEVPDISCEHCEKTVLKTLENRPGVGSVRVDIPAKLVRLEYDPAQIDLEQVGSLLDEEGYPVAGTRAE